MTVYVLEGSNAELYVGMTQNLEQRYAAHVAKRCKTSSVLCNPQIIHTWLAPTRYVASKFERWLHRLQRKNGNSAIIDVILDCPVFSRQIVEEAMALPDTPHERKMLA